jgi:hypothetical protein
MVQKFHFTDKKAADGNSSILLGGIYPLAAPCWLPKTGLTVESASRVMDSSRSDQAIWNYCPGEGSEAFGTALAKFLERNRYGVFINGLFQVQ